MNYYKLVIAYEGTRYAGWQKQPGQLSVEQTLIDAFVAVFNMPLFLSAASRTDAGVHAFGQVICVKTMLVIEPKRLLFAWGNKLPDDIQIRDVQLVDAEFNPRFNVAHKEYHYYIFTKPPLPFAHRYGWYVPELNVQKAASVLSLFTGSHDFRSFCTGKNYQGGTVRRIDSIEIEQRVFLDNALCFVFKGERFMRHMIRRLIGAAVAIANNSQLSVEHASYVLLQKNPSQCLPCAPACGLFLYSILYRS